MLNGLQSVTVAAPVDWQMQMQMPGHKNLKARSNSTWLAARTSWPKRGSMWQPAAACGGMWRRVQLELLRNWQWK